MNTLDKIVSYIAPGMGLERVANRAKLMTLDTHVRKFEAATKGRRGGSFTPVSDSVNQEINADLPELRKRSRSLYFNNPYAKKIPRIIANNVIGTGIMPTHLPLNAADAEKLKLFWTSWAEKTTCDFNDKLTFYGLQKLVMRTVVISGDCLVVKRQVKAEISPIGIQVQVLDPIFLDTSKDEDKGKGYITKGLEYDSEGKLIGYWLFDRHPSERQAKSSFIKAADVIHVYEVDMPGQDRGLPFNSASMLKQKDLDDYEDAELLSKKVAACFSVFVQASATSETQTNDVVENIEPGSVQYLNSGETVSFAQPPQNSSYESFTKTQHRAVAAGNGVTYEQLTGDYSNVNFSSGRMGWLEFQRNVETWQWDMMVPQFCDRVYRWFVDAVKMAPQGISSNAEVNVSWTAPRREMIDPKSEIGAMKDSVRSGFTTWDEVVKSFGYNPDELFNQLKKDFEKFKAAGLMFEWAPALMPQPGQVPGKSDGNGDSEAESKK